MKSEIAERITNETPEEVNLIAAIYAQLLVLNGVDRHGANFAASLFTLTKEEMEVYMQLSELSYIDSITK